MTRTTRAMVDRAFAFFCKAHGFRVARSALDNGAYRLDHAACYGGYQVERIADTSSGISLVLGNRCPAAEMWDRLWFATRAVEAKRGRMVKL